MCKGNSIDTATLEGIVIEELRRLGFNPQMLMEKTKEQVRRFNDEIVPLRNRQMAIEGNLREIERRSMNLIELYEQSLITKEEFVRRRKVLEAEKAASEQDVQAVQTELAANELSRYDIDAVLYALKNLGEVYDLLDVRERQQLLRSILDSVVVDDHNVTYNVFAVPGLFVDSKHMDMHSATLSAGGGT